MDAGVLQQEWTAPLQLEWVDQFGPSELEWKEQFDQVANNIDDPEALIDKDATKTIHPWDKYKL